MKIVIFLTLCVLVKARIEPNMCDGVTIGGINYEIQILKENLDRPYQLAIDYDTNILFFSYTEPSNDMEYLSAFVNLKNDEFGSISGVNGGFANTVDSKRHAVYIGGEGGIYEYDFNSKTANNINVTDDYIWQMFYKDGVYYTSYPSAIAYLYKDGEVKRVAELNDTKVESIAVDNDNNIFFSNSSGLYCYKRTNSSIAKVGNHKIIGFSNDVYGKIYFVTPNGIFAINENTKAVEQIASLDYTFGVAMEADGNIIYASDDSVVRLKSTGKACSLE